MRFALFYHSLYSDWNHGNAHFLRGIVRELLQRGHQVRVYEPRNGWSLQNLLANYGEQPIADFRRIYPRLRSTLYDARDLNLDAHLGGVDVVLVHEWNEPQLVSAIGRHHKAHGGYVLLFHDTHHRSVTAPEQMERYDLTNYDGVLAFGNVIRELYLDQGWSDLAWTWHEAADTRVFRPRTPSDAPLRPAILDGPDAIPRATGSDRFRDLIWIGNWGDGERSEEILQYLVGPVRRLQLNARVHGVRYPDEGRRALAEAGIDYAGWLPNYRVPQAFGESRVTLHIPRRPYREWLHGVPTIRVFEALACGIPLVCVNWRDSENLFTPGKDYLVVDTPRQMTDALQMLLAEPDLAAELVRHGLETVRKRHTCGHRVDELLKIIGELQGAPDAMRPRTAGRCRTNHSMSGRG